LPSGAKCRSCYVWISFHVLLWRTLLTHTVFYFVNKNTIIFVPIYKNAFIQCWLGIRKNTRPENILLQKYPTKTLGIIVQQKKLQPNKRHELYIENNVKIKIYYQCLLTKYRKELFRCCRFLSSWIHPTDSQHMFLACHLKGFQLVNVVCVDSSLII